MLKAEPDACELIGGYHPSYTFKYGNRVKYFLYLDKCLLTEVEMLYSIESNEEIKHIPYKKDYDRWRCKLADSEYQAIIHELSSKIHGTEIQTSSWIPGDDWTDTVYDPIYVKACNQDPVASAKFFGLLVWEAMLQDDSHWAFGRYEKDGIPIEGLTYFKVCPEL